MTLFFYDDFEIDIYLIIVGTAVCARLQTRTSTFAVKECTWSEPSGGAGYTNTARYMFIAFIVFSWTNSLVAVEYSIKHTVVRGKANLLPSIFLCKKESYKDDR